MKTMVVLIVTLFAFGYAFYPGDGQWIDSKGSIIIEEPGTHKVRCATEGAGAMGNISHELFITQPTTINCDNGVIKL